MSKKLSRIMIYGLFGDKNYNIPLNRLDGVTVLHGLNGCGKTTILRMINGFFSGDYTDFDRVPFNGVHFCFDDNTKICIFSNLYNLLIQKCPKENAALLNSIIKEINTDHIDLTPLDVLTDERLFFTCLDNHLKTSKTVYIEKCGNYDLRLDVIADEFKCVDYDQIAPVLKECEKRFSEVTEEQIQEELNPALTMTDDPFLLGGDESVDTDFLGENLGEDLFSQLLKTIEFEKNSSHKISYPQFLFDIQTEVIPKYLNSQRIFQINSSDNALDGPYSVNTRFERINRIKEDLISEVKKLKDEHSATFSNRFDELISKKELFGRDNLESRVRTTYDRIDNLFFKYQDIRRFTLDWDYREEMENNFPCLIGVFIEEPMFPWRGTIDEYAEYIDEIGEPQPSPKYVFVRDFSHPDEAKKLHLFLKDIDEELEILEDVQPKFENFIKYIRKFGFDSKYHFTQDNVEIRSKVPYILTNHFNGDDFCFMKTEHSLPLSALSSGEQNLLLILFDLTFDSQKSSLILIDEPEISLHISWQNKFLKYVKEIQDTYLFDAIIATHSPDIIYDHWDWTVALGPGDE